MRPVKLSKISLWGYLSVVLLMGIVLLLYIRSMQSSLQTIRNEIRQTSRVLEQTSLSMQEVMHSLHLSVSTIETLLFHVEETRSMLKDINKEARHLSVQQKRRVEEKISHLDSALLGLEKEKLDLMKRMEELRQTTIHP